MAKQKKPTISQPLKLNLACGITKIDGFLNVDIVKTAATDVVWDLTKTPWPWPDNSVDEIFCSHFFEHLTGTQRNRFMEQVWRILTPGSGIKIITPYYTSVRASQDPTHQWPPISQHTFLYYDKKWMTENGLSHYDIDLDHCDFTFQYGYDWEPDWQAKSDAAKDFAVLHYCNVVRDIHCVLQARK